MLLDALRQLFDSRQQGGGTCVYNGTGWQAQVWWINTRLNPWARC